MKNIIKPVILCMSAYTYAFSTHASELDYQSIPIEDTISHLRYKPSPGSSRYRKWATHTVEWWYNPSGQNFETAEVVQTIKEAASAWERVSDIKFVYQGITSQSLSNKPDDKFIIGWLDESVFEARFGKYSGYVSLWWLNNSRNMVDGEVSINLGAPKMQKINSFKGAMTHELGHVIGLDHSDESESVMFAEPYHTPEYQQTLRADDILGASTLYPPSFPISSQAVYLNGDTIRVTIPALPEGQTQYVGVALADNGPIFLVTDFNTFIPFDGVSLPVWEGEDVAIDLPVTAEISRGEYFLYLLRMPSDVDPLENLDEWTLGTSTLVVGDLSPESR